MIWVPRVFSRASHEWLAGSLARSAASLPRCLADCAYPITIKFIRFFVYIFNKITPSRHSTRLPTDHLFYLFETIHYNRAKVFV